MTLKSDARSLLERIYEEDPHAFKEVVAHNHKTEHMLECKREAKARGAAGRFRGKVKAKQNNKARGGKLAR
jgi:hypothetical protein